MARNSAQRCGPVQALRCQTQYLLATPAGTTVTSEGTEVECGALAATTFGALRSIGGLHNALELHSTNHCKKWPVDGGVLTKRSEQPVRNPLDGRRLLQLPCRRRSCSMKGDCSVMLSAHRVG